MRDWIERRGEAINGGSNSGFSPSVGIITSGSGLAGGLGYRNPDMFGRALGVELGGQVSVRLYQHYYMYVGLLGARPSTVTLAPADAKVESIFNDSAPKIPGSALYLDVRYRDFPRQTSYGIGLASQQDHRSDYAISGTSIDGVWNWQFRPSTGLSVRGGVLDLDLAPGRNDALMNLDERFVPADLPGILAQPRLLTIGLGLVFDTRSEPQLPSDGVFLGMAIRRVDAADARALEFTRASVDARAYWTPVSDRGVIAVRGLVSADDAGRPGSTPFYLQQSLGGSETLRGYSTYRFQDQALVHASVEYRLRVHRFIEIAPFFDAGTVAPRLSRVSFDTFKTSPGVGLRVRTATRTLFRLDWAHSSEGHRVIFGTGPIF